MPKMKSKKALMKRIKVTGSGNVMIKHANKSHHAIRKSHKAKRQLRAASLVDKTDYKRIRFSISKEGR